MDNLEAQTDSNLQLEVKYEIDHILVLGIAQVVLFFTFFRLFLLVTKGLFQIIGVVLHLNTAVGHAHSLLGWDMQIRIRGCYYGVIWRTCKP